MFCFLFVVYFVPFSNIIFSEMYCVCVFCLRVILTIFFLVMVIYCSSFLLIVTTIATESCYFTLVTSRVM